MQRLPTILVTLALFTLTLPTLAAEQTLILEPDTTEVSFFLEATGHDVEGHLYLQTGQITFDPDTGEASGEIRISALRTETGHTKRDKTMHKKVLESERYPLIVFAPERLEGTLAASGASEVDLVGSISIIGSEHPMSLPTKVVIDGDHMTAETTFRVPYVAWGMEDPSILFLRVAKEVEVSISAAGSITTATASTTTSSKTTSSKTTSSKTTSSKTTSTATSSSTESSDRSDR